MPLKKEFKLNQTFTDFLRKEKEENEFQVIFVNLKGEGFFCMNENSFAEIPSLGVNIDFRIFQLCKNCEEFSHNWWNHYNIMS